MSPFNSGTRLMFPSGSGSSEVFGEAFYPAPGFYVLPFSVAFTFCSGLFYKLS